MTWICLACSDVNADDDPFQIIDYQADDMRSTNLLASNPLDLNNDGNDTPWDLAGSNNLCSVENSFLLDRLKPRNEVGSCDNPDAGQENTVPGGASDLLKVDPWVPSFIDLDTMEQKQICKNVPYLTPVCSGEANPKYIRWFNTLNAYMLNNCQLCKQHENHPLHITI